MFFAPLSPAELTAIVLSLKVGLVATLFALPPAVAVAFALSRYRFPGRALLDGLVHLPLVLPPVVIGYLLLVVFGVRGPIGAALEQAFGVRLVFTTGAAVLAAGVMAFPLLVRSVRLAIEAIDPNLEEAARTLGANRRDVFLSITLPLMVPGILSGAVLAFASALGEFGATITFASNVEGETRTLTLAIYSALQSPGGEAAAARLVALSLVLALGALVAAEAVNRRLSSWLGRA